jgi:hypothetical protein
VTDDRERILAKIRKLQALARSSNEHEAATAAARAAELLAEHQLTEAELGEPSAVVDEGISDTRGGKAPDWEGQLIKGIAAGTGARIYFERRRRGGPWVGAWKAIGTPDQIATARYLLQALRREIERLADAAYTEAFPVRHCSAILGGVVVPCAYLASSPLRCHRCARPRQVRSEARGWKAQWRLGCAVRVALRLTRARLETIARARAAAAPSSPAAGALVRVDGIAQAIAQHIKQGEYKFTEAPPPEIDRTNVDALVLGARAGEQIPLGGGVGLPAPSLQLKKGT